MVSKYNKFYESKKKFPNLKRIEVDGFKVLIGRDSKSNDYLTTIMADDDDVWMHVKGYPGSHVLIRSKDHVVPDETKQKVAKLAVLHSRAKGKDIVKVVVCKAKFVKKERDMNDGQVRVDYNNADYFSVRN